MISPAAPGSPVDDLRADFEARQKAAEPQHVDLWDDGRLVAQVCRSADIAGARGALRAMAVLASGATGVDLTVDDLADVVASATVGLYRREPDGTLTPRGAPTPLRFGQEFAAALGYPEITEPRDAVLLAFTEGDPPDVNALRLMMAATQVAGALVTERAESKAAAEAALGEASALRS